MKIYIMKKLSIEELKGESPLEKWYREMVQKDEDDLSLLDISRMLRQEVFLDIAISSTLRILRNNPFCGEMYEGQLLGLLVDSLQKSSITLFKHEVPFLHDIYSRIEEYDWWCKENRDDYESNLIKFQKLLR